MKHEFDLKMAYDNYQRQGCASNVFILNRLKRVGKFAICLFTLAYVCKSAMSFRGQQTQTVLTIDINSWQLLKEGDHFELRPNEDISPKLLTNNIPDNKLPATVSSSPHLVAKVPVEVETTKNNIQAEEENVFYRDLSYSVIGKDGIIQKADDNQYVLLVWWPPAYLAKDRNFLERNFQGICGKCRLTMDRRYLNRSAVVLFDNVPTKENLMDLPLDISRRDDQVYVLWHRETPSKTYHLRNFMRGTFDTMFNYTMSYRRDSDIVWFLGNTRYAMKTVPHHLLNQPDKYIDKAMKAKRLLAVWVVSNCNNTRGAVARKNYVDKLVAAGLEIDMFGKCFNREVPKKDFYEFLAPYKFYLAFENSWHCPDYLTEKFWRNGLMANVVPVVWGPSKEDVAAVAPENSYVHAENFDSPQDLVEYLHALDKDRSAYRKFFNWRRRVTADDIDHPISLMRPGYEPAMCKLCMQLNKNGGKLPPKTLKSSMSWIFGDDPQSTCLLDTKYSS